MKQRAKRLMALFMAGVFALSTCMTSGPYTVMATEAGSIGAPVQEEEEAPIPATPSESPTPSAEPSPSISPTPSAEPSQPAVQQYEYSVELPEKIEGVNWGDVEVTYGTETVKMITILEENRVTLTNKITDSKAVAITSDNYIFEEITVNDGIIRVGAVRPNVNDTITGEKNELSIGENCDYSISNIADEWKTKIRWSVQKVQWENTDTSGVILTENQKESNKVNIGIDTNGFDGPNKKTVTLVAKIGETQIATRNINVEKKNPGLTIKFDPADMQSWGKRIEITITGEAEFAGEVTITEGIGNSENSENVLIEQGKKATISWGPLSSWKKNYNFRVEYKGSNIYGSETLTSIYNISQENQTFKLNTETVSSTYGDKETEIATIDEKKSTADIKNSTENNKYWNYSFKWSGDKVGGNIDVVGNKVVFTPGSAGTYSVRITRSSDDYNEASVILAITVNKKALHVTNVQAEDRPYDGTTDVMVKAEYNKEDLVDADKEKISGGFVLKTTGTVDNGNADERNEKEVTKYSFTFPSDTDLSIIDNYDLKGSQDDYETKVNVKIEKKALRLKVCTTDGNPLERQYTNYTDLSDEKNVWVEAVESDFVAGENAGSLKGYKVPGVTVDTNIVNSDAKLDKEYVNALIPDEEADKETKSYNATDNYKFDFENVLSKATLKLTAEVISEDNFKDMLTVSNENSVRAYQEPKRKTIYYGIEQGIEIPKIQWKITNDTSTVKNSEINSEYKVVQIAKDDKKTSWDSYVDGKYNPNTKESTQTISVRLATGTETGAGVTDWHDVTLYRDNQAPDATISIVDNKSPMYQFAGKITFGLFNKTGFIAKISDLKDKPDKNESGIKQWEYLKINLKTDADFTKDITKDEFTSQFAGYTFEMAEGTEKKVNLGAASDPGNFVVFVLVEDKVGNKALYGSNGVVVENMPVAMLQLDYGEVTNDTIGQKADSTTQKSEKLGEDGVAYFKNDVSIYATAEDETKEGSQYSGINKINVKVTDLDNKETKDLIKYSMEEELKKGLTLEELKKYSQVTTKNENVTIKEEDSVKFKVSATAEDGAGNTFSDEPVEKVFVIDKKAPKVTNDINNITNDINNDNGIYYSKENIVLTTTVEERFIDDTGINISLSKNENVTTRSLAQWIEMFDTEEYKKQGYAISVDRTNEKMEKNDSSRKITFTIPASKKTEGVYNYRVTATDYANNPSANETAINFCIDCTEPEVNVTYKSDQTGAIDAGNGNSIVYLNGQNDSFTGTIEVKEKNMIPASEDNQNLNCTYDENGVKAYRYTGDIGDATVQSCSDDIKIKGNQNGIALSGLAADIKNKNSWTNKDTTHTYEFKCTVEANYELPNFTVTDLAGNTSKEAKGVAKITLDWTQPLGTIEVTDLISGGSNGKASWSNKLLNALTFGLYGKNFVNATITSKDGPYGGSGITEKRYYLSTSLMSADSLDKLSSSDWKNYNGSIRMDDNRNYIVYEKVVDKAGNLAYYSSDRVIVDHQNPQPEVTITPTTPGWGKGVYSASDNPGFDVYVVDPAGSDGSCAGLAEIKCTITDRTTGHSKPVPLASFSATSAPEATYRTHVSIDPAEFYSNEVQVTVEAKDHSTNPATVESQVIKIDNKAPIVTFSFDKSDVHNGKYYNNDKTLTITVDERNFDESYKPQVTSTAGGGYSISGWSHNGEIHTATVTFSGDSDYTVTYDCYDLAGNKSNTEKLEEFTVDKTKPAIQVSYDNNNALNNDYYKDARTATITITEHNFNPGEVTVTTTAQLDGAPVAAPGVSGWSGSGDTHVATVSYSADADYTFTISATDLASNVSEPYVTDNFTVDQTKPTVEITNIEDHSANNGEVAPVVTLNDINFDSSKTVVHLTGANKGEVDTTGMYTSAATAKGQTLTFHNFAENMDDIYTLTAEATDKAGNVYSTSKMFSVNRDGSTYMYDSYTDELIKNGYTNDPKNLVVSEINVDTLTFQELTVTENGTLKTLEQDKDYEVKESGSEVSWKEYKYTINASNFEEEGDYNVSIYSEDRATNVTTNTSKSKDILFAVDKTSPVIALSNIEDGGRYKVESQKFTANVDDNMALDKVEYYVDGKLQQTFDASEVAAQSGSLELSVDSSSKFQKVSVKAYDKANNEATSADADVLVSASSWVQFYNNKPAFYGTIGGGVAVLAAAVAAGVHFSGAGAAAGTAGAAGAGGFFFLAGKKKKDEEETK